MTDSLLQDTDNQGDPIDPSKNYLEELVGDGKKFKTPEDLARGKYEADLYIRTKNKQFDDLSKDYLQLREQENTRQSLQELIDQMSTTQQKPLPNEENHTVKEAPVFDPKLVKDIARAEFQEQELTKRQQENYNQVRDKLTKEFGNTYPAIVKQQIDELGVSEDLFNTLARTNPKLLLRTLGLEGTQRNESFQAPVRSSQNSDSFSPKGGPRRTWSYYQKLKKEQPAVYLNPKTHSQMLDDYRQLGNDFEDGDFHSK